MNLSMRCLPFVLALAAGHAARAEPVSYQLDPTHSFVHFEVLHFDTATLRGRFGPLQGEVELDRSARRGRVQVVVDVAQVSSGLPVLDARLRGPDLLDADGHPQAFFVAQGFDIDDGGAVRAVRGEFTLRGQGRPLTLVAERFRCYTHPLLRREVCGGDFTAEIERSAWGITYGLPFVADRVRLRVQVEAVRQSAN
ncbi:YceI family protein [Ideonella sp. DXS22W]|uniref:YceI family protein n=1 Tax=Pseudaquabacterium inlustre TaxID=2984192 RepID=A0ABU9CN63_9BURK